MRSKPTTEKMFVCVKKRITGLVPKDAPNTKDWEDQMNFKTYIV